ncbi:13546_t:CDS:2 [Cetraspora pellucida]|uniref:13546_t:CDS:1 n=1 Tax=Cetraspora pellucida TaxID=1433469 RepID=A0A9N8WGS3_9GLOM|nr:13546_t:CDS:2 [Cetraspora pellucida]
MGVCVTNRVTSVTDGTEECLHKNILNIKFQRPKNHLLLLGKALWSSLSGLSGSQWRIKNSKTAIDQNKTDLNRKRRSGSSIERLG